MGQNEEKNHLITVDFSEILKRTFEKANENELTLEKLLEELKADLKPLVVY